MCCFAFVAIFQHLVGGFRVQRKIACYNRYFWVVRITTYPVKSSGNARHEDSVAHDGFCAKGCFEMLSEFEGSGFGKNVVC